MTGKQLIYKVMQHEKALNRIPWVPFAGVHAGKLTGYNAIKVLTDQDKLFESLVKVNEIYKPDGLPIMFDLQIEAEILGCELMWDEKAPPSVKTHPLELKDQIPDYIPKEQDGRIPIALNVIDRLRKEGRVKDTALYGLVCGPFTLASHLRGNNIFMDMIDKPEYVKELLDYASKVTVQMSKYYIQAGIDVVAVVDPLVSQISPIHFNEFLTDVFKQIFSYIRQQGVFSSFFVCGNATRNIEEMCKTSPDCISIDENIDMVEAKEITDKYDIAIGGNIPLTSIMLYGSQQDNMRYTVELLDSLSYDNLIISPGCDMPYDIPPENVIGVQQAIEDTEGIKAMLENYKYQDEAMEEMEIDIPEYERLEKPLIEIFTIDSATCAACTYMVDAVKVAKEHFGDSIDYMEYKATNRENIFRAKKMGIKNLPCILINGELKYSSIIPDRKELFEEIERYINNAK
ncbi:MAG: uroporphyrinogen decarboxylase family protein [Clostridia bacterium]|nr:uroporphyrinogen decarboxylase family protein [Clostridia bacterium]